MIFADVDNTDPRFIKSVDKAIKFKQEQDKLVQNMPVAAPEVIQNQIKQTVRPEETQLQPVNPPQQPPVVIPNQQPNINDEYRGAVTDAYRSNTPDPVNSMTDNKVIADNPSIKNAIEPAPIRPKTSNDYYALPAAQQEQLKQELADAGHWDVNEKFNPEKALMSFYASQPSLKTNVAGQQPTQTTTQPVKEEETLEQYYEKTGLNPMMKYLDSLEPKKKEATEERLRKIAMAKGIGEALRVVADAAYADKGSYGANVSKHDNTFIPKIYEDLRQREFKYDSDKERYGVRKLEAMMKARSGWLAENAAKRKLANDADIARYKEGKADERAGKKAKNDIALAKLKGGIAQRIASSKGSGGKDTRPTLLHKGSNKVIPIDKSYYNDILASILAEKSNSGKGKEVDMILESMQKDPSQQKANALVQENWERFYNPNKDYTGIEPKIITKNIDDSQKIFRFDDIITQQKKKVDQYNAKTAIRNIISSDLDKETKIRASIDAIMETYEVSEDDAMKVLEQLDF